MNTVLREDIMEETEVNGYKEFIQMGQVRPDFYSCP